MQDQNVGKVIQANIQGFNAGDWKRVRDTLAPNSVYVEHATQQRIVGADEIVKADQAWRQAFPDAKGTIQTSSASGNQASVEILWEGTHTGDLAGPGGAIKATGKRVKLPASMVATVEGGKLKETHHYFDMMTLLGQIGAIPQPKA